jgi:Xaa-Pro aminopeptidase
MAYNKNFSRYQERRSELVRHIRSTYPDVKSGAVLLCAGFEDRRFRFRPVSTFYYYTGITEPGVIATIDLDDVATVWIPEYKDMRSSWIHSDIKITPETASHLCIDHVRPLGEAIAGYEIQPYSPTSVYSDLIASIRKILSAGGALFVSMPSMPGKELEQRYMLDQLALFMGTSLDSYLIDISGIIGTMRRKKDTYEIEQIYKAINITCMAQEVAASTIAPNVQESEVQARIEYIFTASKASCAFSTIVGGGHNASILHYRNNTYTFQAGDLVVVDIGAEYGLYSADISRTYPASGSFTERQKELYAIVLDTQKYVASIAKPGYWLNNNSVEPEKSLHHCAVAYLQERGYAQYFTHGIGHYLGLDTHDVGSYSEPLVVGDVFTIEPGLYLPDENIGIRIEDDYWMTNAGLICLSDHLPKSIDGIETLMKQSLQSNSVNEAE